MRSNPCLTAACACAALAPSVTAQSLARTFLPPSPYPGDCFGTSVACAGDVDGDGVGDYAVGSSQDFFYDPGRVSVMSGANGGVIRIVYGALVGSEFGKALVAVGDVDGDGVSDLLAYAPTEQTGYALSPELRLFSTATGVTLWSLSPPSVAVAANGSWYAIGGGRDVTGDGVPDFAVAGYWTATQATTRVFSGATKAIVYDVAVAPPKLALGPIAFLGDIDGDGLSEIACGVWSNNAWEVAIASGATGAVLRTCSPSSPIAYGLMSIAALGDIDGDGVPDLAFGTYQQLGRVEVFSGANAALIRVHAGSSVNSGYGMTVAGGVDLDRDGVGDVLVGAPLDDAHCADCGSVFAYSGRTGAPIENCGFSTGPHDWFGGALTGAGDVDGDGFGDYFVGALGVGASSNFGRAYLVSSTPLPVRAIGASQVNSQGCTPTVTTTGHASAANSAAFQIQCAQLLNQKTTTFFYGVGDPVNAPFHGWLRYSPNPLRRTHHVSSGGSTAGSDCTGSQVFDFNAHIASGVDPSLVVGARVVGQFYSRDPGSPSTTNLTSAVEFVINP